MTLDDEIQAKVQKVLQVVGPLARDRKIQAIAVAAIVDDGAGGSQFCTLHVAVKYPLGLLGLLGELEAQIRSAFRASHQPAKDEEVKE